MYKIGEVWGALNPYLKNYGKKWKYHVCVCNRRGMFLLVSHSGSREGSLEIEPQDFLPKNRTKGFICCNNVYYFTPDQLKKLNGKFKGNFSPKILLELLDHVNECETLVEEEKEKIVNSLGDYLSKL